MTEQRAPMLTLMWTVDFVMLLLFLLKLQKLRGFESLVVSGKCAESLTIFNVQLLKGKTPLFHE